MDRRPPSCTHILTGDPAIRPRRVVVPAARAPNACTYLRRPAQLLHAAVRSTPIDLRLRNRRLGERVPIRTDAIEWLPPGPKRLLRAPKPQQAQLVDLSITGAKVLAPASPVLPAGTHVEIRVRGHRGVVIVRWSAPSDVPGMIAYGVQFISLDEGLNGLVVDTIGSHRPDLTWRWETEH